VSQHTGSRQHTLSPANLHDAQDARNSTATSHIIRVTCCSMALFTYLPTILKGHQSTSRRTTSRFRVYQSADLWSRWARSAAWPARGPAGAPPAPAHRWRPPSCPPPAAGAAPAPPPLAPHPLRCIGTWLETRSAVEVVGSCGPGRMSACGTAAVSTGWCWHVDQPLSADAVMRPMAEHALCGSVGLRFIDCNAQSSPANVVRLRNGCGLDSPCPGRSTASTRALCSRSTPSSKSAASSRLLADLSHRDGRDTSLRQSSLGGLRCAVARPCSGGTLPADDTVAH
jgi:hypothetical protein